jgi:hypothetical protein
MTTIRSFQNGTFTKSSLLIIIVSIIFMSLFMNSLLVHKTGFPQAEISNGLLTAKIYLPDVKSGYYRSTRFDWSGAVYSLQYEHHNFYGQWFDRIDPKVVNWIHRGPEIVSGPCSALFGPVDEFETPLGWNEAKPGETFIKIGVGVLRKGNGEYNRYAPYKIINPGTWNIKKGNDSVEFTQKLSDSNSGYAYIYRKLVRLVKNKPEMVIEHFLKNTGRLPIQSDVYNHNFVALDKQPPGPDFTVKVPFQIQGGQSLHKELAEIRGNQIVFLRPLTGEDEAVVFVKGFSDNARDNKVIIENKKVGAGMKIICNKPLIKEFLWSVRTVLAVEPYISINIQPGDEFTWKDKFVYYTMPAGK